MKKLYRALDVCCCDGGASEGLSRSKVFSSITGIDIDPHPDYPFKFIQQDIKDIDPEWIRKNFDFMWLSPPCQKFSWGNAKERNKGNDYHINLIPEARELVEKSGIPAVIENVVGAPLRKDLILCGVMFGLGVIRHRLFEIHNFHVNQPKHVKHERPYLDAFNQYKSKYMQIAGHGGNSASFKMSDWKIAMDIKHINKRENLIEAIPPAYAQYIAMQFSDFNLYHKTLDMY